METMFGIGLGFSALDPFNVQKDALQAQQDSDYRNEQRMLEAEKKRDQEFNKLNQKKPNIAALLRASERGISSTMLTGPTGVDPASLTLGRTSLLGA